MINIRLVEETELERVAALFLRSRRVALPFLPILYRPDQDLIHMRDMMRRGIMEVAVKDRNILGFIVDLDGWVAHLYLDPDFRRQGFGNMLLDRVKSRHAQLDLWCFQSNWAGRAFYEKNGFVCVRETDGDNEENLPDRLYRWQKP